MTMVHHAHTPQPRLFETPEAEEKCRHLALQSFVSLVCLDCGEVTETHDELTGLAVYDKG